MATSLLNVCDVLNVFVRSSMSGDGELGLAGLQTLVWKDSIQLYLRGADCASLQVFLLSLSFSLW